MVEVGIGRMWEGSEAIMYSVYQKSGMMLEVLHESMRPTITAHFFLPLAMLEVTVVVVQRC